MPQNLLGESLWGFTRKISGFIVRQRWLGILASVLNYSVQPWENYFLSLHFLNCTKYRTLSTQPLDQNHTRCSICSNIMNRTFLIPSSNVPYVPHISNYLILFPSFNVHYAFCILPTLLPFCLLPAKLLTILETSEVK